MHPSRPTVKRHLISKVLRELTYTAKSHRARKKRSHRQRSQHLEPQDLQQTTEPDGLEGHIPRPARKALGHVVRFGRLGTDVVISLYIWTVCGSLVQEI